MTDLAIFVDLAPAPAVVQMLRRGTKGHHLIFAREPAASVLSPGRIEPAFADVDVAFGQPDPEAIRGARRLRFVQISSSGITRYDKAEFRRLMAERNIAVCNSARVYSEPCALHALSFILAQARHLPKSLKTMTANGTAEWDSLRDSCKLLQGATALILGYGAIGRRLAELLKPLGMRVLAYRRRARGDEGVPVLSMTDLDLVLATEADHVINILPHSPETIHFFDARRLAAIKPGAVFYSIGRGATVDQEALVDALHSGRLAAAWLDVTDPEPLPVGHPLWAEPNCHITPHVAGGHSEEQLNLTRHFLENLDRFMRGEQLLDRVM
jgi:phosphoglycerate dehydrogenase-like enzyme